MFKTPLQERAEREIISKDKEVADKTMDVWLGEADRLLEAYLDAAPYQLLSAASVPLSGEIKFKTDMETAERKAHREACRHYGVEGHCRGLSHCGHGYAYDILCTPTAKCRRMKKYDKEHKEQ